jgi:hypothetical protein
VNDQQYFAARAAFERTAGMDAPDLPEEPMDRLQTRLWRWQVAWYGVPDARDLALGIGEEVGEWVDSATGEQALDAVADVAIYAIQLCTVLRLDAGTLMARPEGFQAVRTPASLVGRLQHVTLKAHQRIRGLGDREAARRATAEALVAIFAWLGLEAGRRRRDLSELVAEVAEVVMQRQKHLLPAVAA